MAANNAGERKDPPGHRPAAEPQLQEDSSSSNSNSTEVESLDSIARWILSIPPAHVTVLQHMREYRDLLQACRGLQREHGKLLAWRRLSRDDNKTVISDNDNNNNNDNDNEDLTELTVADMFIMPNTTTASLSSFSFLQFMASDELVLKILDFLEAKSLCQVMQTCSRFRDLVLHNARRRTVHIGRERQLPNVLQLLRAKEHIQGTGAVMNESNGGGGGGPFVRVPTLLLSRCVRVTDAGDAEYNGIYCCTGINGNGFVFTKPREPFQRIQVQRRRCRSNHQSSTGDPDDTDVIAQQGGVVSTSSQQHSNNSNDDNETYDDNDGDQDNLSLDRYVLLRCIIAKRFSNETLLWYFSKEVVVAITEEEDQGGGGGSGEIIRASAGNNRVTQRYSFWARLSQLGDATPDLCRYPSQTSNLRRNGEGWQPLVTTTDTTPPTVELIN